MSDPRPLQQMHATLRRFPSAPDMVSEFRARRGHDLPEWPEWCFLPMGGWYAVVCDGYGVPSLSVAQSAEIATLAAMGTWRYSQGIYRFDADILQALTDTVLSGEIPTDVLLRLPEWCVYIETPGFQWMGRPLHGFWAHLEWDGNTTGRELRLLLDTDVGPIGMPVHLGDWTVTEAVDRTISEASRQAKIAKILFSPGATHVQELATAINPLMSLVLYLCASEPDIEGVTEPGATPGRPTPTKTKKGWRMFVPKKPKIWSVGQAAGDTLRENAGGELSGRSVETHLRKAHWHGYWTGPKGTDQRKFIYHWLPPVVVRGREP